MTTELAYNSRTYGRSVHAPETLSDPIANALKSVQSQQQQQQLQIQQGPTKATRGGPVAAAQSSNQVALAAPTKSIEIVGGRSRFVDDEDVDSIVATWLDQTKDISDIKLIDLALNKISSKGMLTLCRAISERPGQLLDIDVDSNKLGDDALKAIAKYIVNTPAVRVARLDLSTNNFTDLGVIEFVAALRNRKAELPLRTLLLRQCNLANAALRAICEYVADRDCVLTSLHVSGNDFHELDGIKYVADAVTANRTLVDLNVSNCFDHVARWEPIVEALQSNFVLQQFNIAVMGKKPEPLVPLDEHLKNNKRVANVMFTDVDKLRLIHKREIEALQVQHRRREAQLEQRVQELARELEMLRGPAAAEWKAVADASEAEDKREAGAGNDDEWKNEL